MYKDRENGETVTHVSDVEARSGSRTRMTRNVLVASLALVLVALVGALILGYFETSRSGADDITADNTAQSAP